MASGMKQSGTIVGTSRRAVSGSKAGLVPSAASMQRMASRTGPMSASARGVSCNSRSTRIQIESVQLHGGDTPRRPRMPRPGAEAPTGPSLRLARRHGKQGARVVAEIDRRVRDLTERARNGRLSSAEMTDGTITLSSTAGFMPGQWSVSTPLINQPQVVNFQPGSPIQKPVVVDGEIVVRTMLPCGLSYDHRAMDGEPVGRFIRKLSDLLSNPELMLL